MRLKSRTESIPAFAAIMRKVFASAGYFESNGQVRRCQRRLFSFPAACRLSGGLRWREEQPYHADAPHTVRSMALLFKLPDGEEWRTGMNNIPVFPVNSAQGFYDLLLASAPDPATGKPDPAKMSAFLAEASGIRQGASIDPQPAGLVRICGQHLQQPERLPFHQCPRRGDAGSLVNGAGPTVRSHSGPDRLRTSR